MSIHTTTAEVSTLEFFETLYDGSSGYLCRFQLPSLHAQFYPVNEMGTLVTDALRSSTKEDQYFGLGVFAAPQPPGKRGEARQILGIPGIWTEVDFDPSGKDKKGKPIPTTLDEALSLLDDLPLRPTFVVVSGHGIHIYWAADFWVFKNDTDRIRGQMVLRQFYTTIRKVAANREWTVNDVSDITRVLRIPDTFNRKQANDILPVSILEASGLTYKWSDFEPLLSEIEKDDTFVTQISVEEWQHYNPRNPCPICDGWSTLPKGHGQRCYGMYRRDGLVAFCTREEFAKKLKRHDGALGAFPHELFGACGCGELHRFPFPMWVYPPAIQQFIEETAASFNVDPSTIATAVLVICGNVLGTTRQIVLKRGFVEYPCFWLAIVDLAGSTKSPALKYLCRFLAKEDYRRQKQYQDAKKEYDKRYEAWKAHHDEGEQIEPSPPKPTRFLVGDITTERLVQIQADNPPRIIQVLDELASWLKGLNQYKKDGNDREAYNSFWANSQLNRDRVKDEEYVALLETFVGLLGLIPPDPLKKFTAGGDDGMTDRFLFNRPTNPAAKWTDAEVSEGAEKAYEDTLSKLMAKERIGVPVLIDQFDAKEPEKPQTLPVSVYLADDAYPAWTRHYNKMAKAMDEREDTLRGAYSKFLRYAGRFALTLHEIWYVNGGVADEATVDAATEFRTWAVVNYFRVQANYVHQRILFSSKKQDQLTRLIKLLRKYEGQLPLREVQRRLKLESSDEAKKLVEFGAEHGLVEVCDVPTKDGKMTAGVRLVEFQW